MVCCMAALAPMNVALTPFLQHSGVDLVVHLLRQADTTAGFLDGKHQQKLLTKPSDTILLVSQLAIHRKFSMLFISPAVGGLLTLMFIPPDSMNPTCVARALLNLSNHTDAMEKICLLGYLSQLYSFLPLELPR